MHSHRVLLFEEYLFTRSVIFLARFRIDRNVKHEFTDRNNVMKKKKSSYSNKDLIACGKDNKVS